MLPAVGLVAEEETSRRDRNRTAERRMLALGVSMPYQELTVLFPSVARRIPQGADVGPLACYWYVLVAHDLDKKHCSYCRKPEKQLQCNVVSLSVALLLPLCTCRSFRHQRCADPPCEPGLRDCHVDQGVLLPRRDERCHASMPVLACGCPFHFALPYPLDVSHARPSPNICASLQQVDVSGVDTSKFDDGYFKALTKPAKSTDFTEDEAAPQKMELTEERKADQKALDKSIVAAVKKVEHLKAYLSKTFSLSNGQYPHALKF